MYITTRISECKNFIFNPQLVDIVKKNNITLLDYIKDYQMKDNEDDGSIAQTI